MPVRFLPVRARAYLSALCIGLLCLSCTSEQAHRSAPPSSALSRGIAWVLAHQTPEGTFRDSDFQWGGGYLSFFRSADPATAAEVLFCLSRCLKGSVPQEPVDRAVAYLRAHITPDGMLEDTIATAYAIGALVALNGTEDHDVKRMTQALLARQACEANGHPPGDAGYGGWALGVQRGPNRDEPSIFTTAEVVEALRAANVSDEDPVWERALTFVARRQQADGGFKCWWDTQSTGWSTITGIRVLLACDADCAASGAWLDAHGYGHNMNGSSTQWAYVHVQRLRAKPLESAWIEDAILRDLANPPPMSTESDPLRDFAWAVAALAEAAAGPSGK